MFIQTYIFQKKFLHTWNNLQLITHMKFLLTFTPRLSINDYLLWRDFLTRKSLRLGHVLLKLWQGLNLGYFEPIIISTNVYLVSLLPLDKKISIVDKFPRHFLSSLRELLSTSLDSLMEQVLNLIIEGAYHSSEMGGLCLMKWPNKILQNLPYSNSSVYLKRWN